MGENNSLALNKMWRLYIIGSRTASDVNWQQEKNYCHSPTRFDCNKLEVTDVLYIIGKKYSQFT